MDELKQINLQEEESRQAPQVKEVSPMESVVPIAKSGNTGRILVIAVVIGIVVGGVSGFLFAKNRLGVSAVAPGTSAMQQNPSSQGSIHVGDTFGTNDTTTFKDEVEGVLQKGGIGGEGTHHLVRGANASQWVYLTSSVVDLDMFVGDSVHVWGQTNTGKKAGWLMDVGKLKVLQLNAAPADSPFTSGQPE